MIYNVIDMYTQYMMNATGNNEMLVSFITIGVMGSIMGFIKYVPTFLWYQFIRHATTSFTINNTTYESGHATRRMLSWLSTVINTNSSRTIGFNPLNNWLSDDQKKNHNYLGTGYGFHWFILNKKLFWLDKNKLDSAGSEIQKEEYTFRCFGRSHKPFNDLVMNFAEECKVEGMEIYTLEGTDWQRSAITSPRLIDSVALPNEKKVEIIENINNFKNNKAWFTRASLPYKLTYILYGKPGSGKTSLIKAIASEFDMNLCVLNINSMSDGSLQRAIATMPRNSILAIEDFDSSSATNDRGITADSRLQTVANKISDATITKKSTDTLDEDFSAAFSMLTLTGLLNALDGLIPLDDCIIFLTTNSIETVDPAVYRKGRVDYLMEMNELNGIDVMGYSKNMFPDYDFSGYDFHETMGSALNEALLYSRGDVGRYIHSLKSNNVCSSKEYSYKLEKTVYISP